MIRPDWLVIACLPICASAQTLTPSFASTPPPAGMIALSAPPDDVSLDALARPAPVTGYIETGVATHGGALVDGGVSGRIAPGVRLTVQAGTGQTGVWVPNAKGGLSIKTAKISSYGVTVDADLGADVHLQVGVAGANVKAPGF